MATNVQHVRYNLRRLWDGLADLNKRLDQLGAPARPDKFVRQQIHEALVPLESRALRAQDTAERLKREIQEAKDQSASDLASRTIDLESRVRGDLGQELQRLQQETNMTAAATVETLASVSKRVDGLEPVPDQLVRHQENIHSLQENLDALRKELEAFREFSDAMDGTHVKNIEALRKDTQQEFALVQRTAQILEGRVVRGQTDATERHEVLEARFDTHSHPLFHLTFWQRLKWLFRGTIC